MIHVFESLSWRKCMPGLMILGHIINHERVDVKKKNPVIRP